MRVTDIVGRSQRSKKKLRNNLIFITLTIIAIAIALVVLFTTLTGRAGIVVKKDDFRAGIAIKDSIDGELTTTLLIDPISDASDVYEGYINFEEKNFLNTDGQYFDPYDRPYIAYTFYVTNTSEIDQNLSLKVLIKQSRYNLEQATVFKIYVHHEDGTFDVYYLSYNGVHIGLVTEENGGKAASFKEGIKLIVPGNDQFLKITYVSYISPDMSVDGMRKGAVNFEILLEILEGDDID